MKAAEDFDVFVAIVDAGSVSEAARVLQVPRTTLSRQLGRLEARLGTRLLHRSTRRIVPTRAGDHLYARARALVQAAEAAAESVQRLDDTPRGLLRVSGPPLHDVQMGSLFAMYMRRYPEVSVELESTMHHVDLVAEQVDLALRAGIVREPSLIARTLLKTEILAVASPAYLKEHGEPTRVDDLSRHNCIRRFEGGSRPSSAWLLRSGATTDVDGPLATNDLMAMFSAALDGLGIALLPRPLVQPELERGRLRPVLPDTVGFSSPLSLVWIEREFVDPKIRAFVEVAVEWSKLLDW